MDSPKRTLGEPLIFPEFPEKIDDGDICGVLLV
jgi:hypothetical protein